MTQDEIEALLTPRNQGAQRPVETAKDEAEAVQFHNRDCRNTPFQDGGDRRCMRCGVKRAAIERSRGR